MPAHPSCRDCPILSALLLLGFAAMLAAAACAPARLAPEDSASASNDPLRTGRALLDQGSFSQVLDAMPDRERSSPAQLLLRATAAMELSRLDEAGELLELAARQDDDGGPDEDDLCGAEFLLATARLRYLQGDFRGCLDLLATPEDPASPATLRDSAACRFFSPARVPLLRGRAATALSLFGDASMALEQAEAEALSVADTALIQAARAELAVAMGDYPAALSLYNHALAGWGKAFPVHFPIHPQTGRLLSGLAQAEYLLDDLEGCRLHLLSALAIFSTRLGPAHPETSLAINDLGAVSLALGDTETAVQAFSRAGSAVREALGPDHPDLAVALNNLAVACKRMGDYARARKVYEEALAIRRNALGPDHPDTAQSEANLALVLARLGQPGKALELMESALSSHRAALGPDHPSVATDAANLAVLARRMGDTDRAVSLLMEALAIRRAGLGPDHPAVGRTLENLALALESRDRQTPHAAPLPSAPTAGEAHAQALAILERSLGPDHPESLTLASNQALRVYREGESNRAMALLRDLLKRELAIHGDRHPMVAADRVNLALMLLDLAGEAASPETGRPFLLEARDLFSRVLATAESLGDSELAWRCRDGLARVLRLDGRLPAATLMAKLAVETLLAEHASFTDGQEAMARMFLGSRHEPFRRLAALLVDQDRLAEAEAVLRLLRSDEAAPLVRSDHPLEAPFTDAETGQRQAFLDIRNTLAADGNRLDELLEQKRTSTLSDEEEQELADIRNRLAEAHETFAAFLDALSEESVAMEPLRAMEVGERQLEAIPALRGRLRDMDGKAAILHFLVTDETLYTLLTTSRVTVVRTSPVPRRLLAQSVLAFRAMLADPESDPVPLASQLYELLLAPVEDELEGSGAETLLVSPDGPLRYLPFAALRNGDGWLVERYGLALFSPLFPPGTRTGQPSVAALGVSRSFSRFPPLPAVPMELEAIVRRPGEDRDGVAPGEIRLDRDFTMFALQEALDMGHPVLHIASHFAFSPTDVQDSYLLLGDGETLTLAGIRNQGMDFGSLSLLTLSACNTAMSVADADGHEIDGFGTLAAKQGAAAVMATLWAVADGSTGVFMHRFYDAHFVGKLSLSQALQHTQLAFIHDQGQLAGEVEDTRRSIRVTPLDGASLPLDTPDLSHPFYWAPFVLMSSTP